MAMACGSLFAARLPETSGSTDPVVFSFCTVGDSRADADDPALPAQDKIWLQNTKVLSRLIREINQAPPMGGPDAIRSDQRQLSYSFDCQTMHFAVINTDPCGNDSHAPVHWLNRDLAQAQERGSRHFFVFGHKMAFTYAYKPEMKAKGLDAFPEEAQAFWKVIQEYHATYFCGHEHIYHAMQPAGSGQQQSWQIIVGSGGSPFEAQPGESQNPNDRMYVWAAVQVHRSGRVHMEARGFDEHFGPTHLLESIELEATARLHSSSRLSFLLILPTGK